jgi:DNA-binding NtrC family response regulator
LRILIADDEPRFAKVLRQALVAKGYADVSVVSNAHDALEDASAHPCDLLVTDLCMPGMSGIDLMAEMKRRWPGIDIILMTAFADVQTAKSSLKGGALDYLVKPFHNEELVSQVRQVQARRRAAGIEHGNEREGIAFEGLIGTSPQMRRTFASLERAARSDASVLLLGESGTGKELAARALHALSARHAGPFVDIHCAAIPEHLLESELFGHEKGAFTSADSRKKGRLELADAGTLFLDEIGEMPLSLQPKLLRFLQERHFVRIGGTDAIAVNVRVVAATNRDLSAEVEAGRFREDLFYRLEVLTTTLPPLRERTGDVGVLVRHFLRTGGRSPDAIAPDALSALEQYRWPGNVRELRNAVERAIIESENGPIGRAHLPDKMTKHESEDHVPAGPSRTPLPDTLDHRANERQLIEQALASAGGNKTRAAEMLGMTRRRLYSRMKLLEMASDEEAD